MWTIGQKARLPNMSEKYYVVSRFLKQRTQPDILEDGNIYVAKGRNHPTLSPHLAIVSFKIYIHIFT